MRGSTGLRRQRAHALAAVRVGALLLAASCAEPHRADVEPLPPGWRSSKLGPEDCPAIARPERDPLVALVSERRYAELESLLLQYREATDADPICEGHLFYAYGFAAEAPPDALDAWVEARPDAFAPVATRGLARKRAGVDARGHAYGAYTSQEQFERMAALHASALEDVERALALQADHPVPHIVKVEIAKGSGGFAKARLPAAAGLEQRPGSYLIRRHLLSSAHPKWGGSIAEMERIVREIPAIEGGDPRLGILRGFPHAARGWQAARRGDPREAIDHYSRALQYGDFATEWSRARATAYRAVGAYRKALADVERILSIEPGSRPVATLRGTLLAEAGDREAGIAALSAILAEHPDYALALYSRGFAYFLEERYEDAAADYARLFETGSASPEVAENLGYIQVHHLKEPAAGERTLRWGTEQDPGYPRLWYRLGEALEELGRAEEARDSFRRFLALARPTTELDEQLIAEARGRMAGSAR